MHVSQGGLPAGDLCPRGPRVPRVPGYGFYSEHSRNPHDSLPIELALVVFEVERHHM
jgi:hypothetical protein